jgi:hypothetical protein
MDNGPQKRVGRDHHVLWVHVHGEYIIIHALYETQLIDLLGIIIFDRAGGMMRPQVLCCRRSRRAIALVLLSFPCYLYRIALGICPLLWLTVRHRIRTPELEVTRRIVHLSDRLGFGKVILLGKFAEHFIKKVPLTGR